ncbi:MAG: GGDEF domain-containing protein [Oscillospiraceae bacterium]|nr:GGDEF domain-containing protein [Oscillospiraceae bacterium]
MLLLTLREEVVCAIILLYLIFYYLFNKIKDKEMLFLKLASISLMHVLLDIITVITVNNRDVVPDFVNHVLHILFYVTGIGFGICFYNYIINFSAFYKHARLLRGLGYGMLGLFLVMQFFLPVEYLQGNQTAYSYGPLVILGYATFLVLCTICLILLLASRKSLERRIRWALIPILIIMYIGIIAQALVPELLLTGADVTLICIGAFVALDNPERDFVKQALWDFPTGLKNRNCFSRDLPRYASFKRKKRDTVIGFIVADLNNLKIVNDTYGHQEGDRFIAAAAAILRKNLTSAENVYRIGGDEFIAVYLSPNDKVISAEMEKVVYMCSQVQNFSVPLQIAMGYASGSISDNLEEIIKLADKQMYTNKKNFKITE